MKKHTISRVALILLSLVGIVISYLTLDLHIRIAIDPSEVPSYCHVSESINCLPVIGSEYSMLFGVPLGSYGIVFYLGIMVLTLLNSGFFSKSLAIKSTTLLLVTFLSLIASAGLFYISKVKIGAICPLCLGLYAVNLLCFISAAILPRSDSLVTSIARGAKDGFIYIKMVLGFESTTSSTQNWFSRGGVVAFVIVGWCAITLPQFMVDRFLSSDEFKIRVQNMVGEEVKGWEMAPRVELPYEAEGVNRDFAHGNPDAPVSIVEFSDYECPACRVFFPAVKDILKEYGDKVFFVHRNFPIDNSCNRFIPQVAHHNACVSAMVARCAGEQGKFWDANEFLFTLPSFDDESDPATVKKDVLQLGEKLGLDTVGMKECLNAPRTMDKIKSDIEVADKIGLEGTPSFWINGKPLKHASPVAFRAVIDKILSAK